MEMKLTMQIINRRIIRRLAATGVLLATAMMMLPAHSDVKKVWLGVKGATCAT